MIAEEAGGEHKAIGEVVLILHGGGKRWTGCMKGGGKMMGICWVKKNKYKNRQEILLPVGRRGFC